MAVVDAGGGRDAGMTIEVMVGATRLDVAVRRRDIGGVGPVESVVEGDETHDHARDDQEQCGHVRGFDAPDRESGPEARARPRVCKREAVGAAGAAVGEHGALHRILDGRRLFAPEGGSSRWAGWRWSRTVWRGRRAAAARELRA
jgi:hypothetical protein